MKYNRKKLQENSIIIIFITFSLIMGIMFSVLIPIPRVQDEKTHFDIILSNLGMTDYTSLFPTEYVVKGSVLDAISTDESLSQRPFTDKEDYKKAFLKENQIGLHFNERPHLIKLIPYAPSAVALLIGALFKLPLLYIFHLCDFFSLLFYITIGVLTLKLAPVKKDLFLFVLLMPTALSLAASCNYDSVLLPLCSFNLAYIMHLKLGDFPISYNHLGVLILTTLIIGLIKIPYILLSGLVFLIPLDRFNLHLKVKDRDYDLTLIFKKIRVPLFIILFVAVIILIFTLDNPNTKTLAAAILAPKDALFDILRTYKIQSYEYLIGLILCIGHFDYIAGNNLIKVFLTALIIFWVYQRSDRDSFKLKIKEKIFIWVIIIAVAIMIALSQYIWQLKLYHVDLSSSIKTYMEFFGPLEIIGGVQGRYFIPLVIPFLLTINPVKIKINLVIFRAFELLFFLLITLYCLRALLFAYWS